MPNKPQYFKTRYRVAPRPAWQHHDDLSASQRGYDRRWQAARVQQLSAFPICQVCNRVPAVEVDHRVPLAAGGPRLDPANLRSICRKCHQIITQNFKNNGVNEMPPRLAFGFWG